MKPCDLWNAETLSQLLSHPTFSLDLRALDTFVLTVALREAFPPSCVEVLRQWEAVGSQRPWWIPFHILWNLRMRSSSGRSSSSSSPILNALANLSRGIFGRDDMRSFVLYLSSNHSALHPVQGPEAERCKRQRKGSRTSATRGPPPPPSTPPTQEVADAVVVGGQLDDFFLSRRFMMAKVALPQDEGKPSACVPPLCTARDYSRASRMGSTLTTRRRVV